jgi:hypothetical protein
MKYEINDLTFTKKGNDMKKFEAKQKKDWGFNVGDLVTYNIYNGIFRITKKKYDRINKEMMYTLHNTDEKNDFNINYVMARNLKLINNYKEEDIKWFESSSEKKFWPGDLVIYNNNEYIVVDLHFGTSKEKTYLIVSNDRNKSLPKIVKESELAKKNSDEYKDEDIMWFESKKTNLKMNNLKTFQNFVNEEADYRNVTGNGSMGSPSDQRIGPSFNKGPDAETYNRPDVIGVETDYVEDPYFAASREQRKKRSRKPKYIEKMRRDKSEYLKRIDKETNSMREAVNEMNSFTFLEMLQQCSVLEDFEKKLKEIMVGRLVSFPCVFDPRITVSNDARRKEFVVKDVKVEFDTEIVITNKSGERYIGRYLGYRNEDLNVYVLSGDKKIVKLKNLEIDPYDEEKWGYNFESHIDIDPYGEEDWGDDKQFNIGDILISKVNIFSHGRILLTKGKRYVLTGITNDANNNLYWFVCDDGIKRSASEYKIIKYFDNVN